MEILTRVMTYHEMENAVDRVAKRMCELAGIDPMERITMRVDDTLLVTDATSLIPLQVHRGTMADFAYKGFRRRAQMQLLGWMAVAQVMAEGGAS